MRHLSTDTNAGFQKFEDKFKQIDSSTFFADARYKIFEVKMDRMKADVGDMKGDLKKL